MQKPQLLEKMCVGQLCLTYLVNIENRLDVCDNVDFQWMIESSTLLWYPCYGHITLSSQMKAMIGHTSFWCILSIRKYIHDLSLRFDH